MEVIPPELDAARIRKGILHACGGDPYKVPKAENAASVFSTHVEVILCMMSKVNLSQSILHACGGDPVIPLFLVIGVMYSPRMWR